MIQNIDSSFYCLWKSLGDLADYVRCPRLGHVKRSPCHALYEKSGGKTGVGSSGRSDISITFDRTASSKLVHRSFLDFLNLYVFGHLDDCNLRGWILYNIKLYVVVVLVLQKCSEMCFSFFCQDSFRATQWKLRMCYSPVCLFECLWQHQGLNPAAFWSFATLFA